MGGGEGRSLTPLRINEPLAHEPLARKTRRGKSRFWGARDLHNLGILLMKANTQLQVPD